MGPPGQTLVDWAWVLQGNSSRLEMGPPGEAAPQQIQDQGSRRRLERRRSEDWRAGAVVDAGAEVILPDLAEISLLIYPGAGSP